MNIYISHGFYQYYTSLKICDLYIVLNSAAKPFIAKIVQQERNLLLINIGNGIFDDSVVDLSGGTLNTVSIIVLQVM